MSNDQTDNPKDYVPQNSYQDDIDTKGTDMVTHEMTDDPVEGFGVPASEFKKELNYLDGKTTDDEDWEDTEDRREQLQDLNQGDNDRD